MSEVKVNKISPRSGTTVTLGDSGDTISIPSGVTFDASSGSLSGTLTTAAQPNITSVGTLTSFASTGIDDNATSTAITIDSGQRVRINNTTSTGHGTVYNLIVGNESSGGDSGILITAPNNENSYVSFGDSDGVPGLINYNHASNFLRTYVNGSERMRIDSSGQVGIGTSSPIRNLVLATSSGDTTFRIETASQNNDVLTLRNGDGRLDFANTNMTILSNGKVGIGTNSPDGKLDIAAPQTTSNKFTSPHLALTATSQSNSDGFTGISYAAATATNYGWTVGATRWSGGTGASHFTFTNHENSATGNERMRIDRSGKVAIGTTASNANLELETNEIGTGNNLASGGICLRNSGTVSNGDILPITGRFVSSAEPRAGIGFITETQDGIAGYGGAIGFYTLGSADGAQLTSSHERMRIDKSGNVLIGMTGTSGNGLRLYYNNNGGSILFRQSYGNGYGAVFFQYQTTQVGSIYTYTNSTSYNTSSDYRLKENVSYDFDATSRIKQLKPARFNFISEPNKTVDGFLAHEVSDIVPEAITGEKDAVKEDGTPDYQGIDQSKLVPLLVKTIQELEARITTLENA